MFAIKIELYAERVKAKMIYANVAAKRAESFGAQYLVGSGFG